MTTRQSLTYYHMSLLDNETNDQVIFAEEESYPDVQAVENETGSGLPATWKVLIVDDEAEVHKITKLALDDFVLEGKKLHFISAYSGLEAKEIMRSRTDIAMIFLDVVMETDHAGLEVVKYIREELGNQLVRIVLRTGQPGQAPESLVILNYDINDYKTKTELTAQKLFTTTVTALRAYSAFARSLEISSNLQLEIAHRQKVEIALRESEAKEKHKAQSLEKALQELQQTQAQLIQAEKMSSLGQMVAGIAHEINNPISFIFGNIKYAEQYVTDLMGMLDLYQQYFQPDSVEIQQKAEDIDLDFLKTDLPHMLNSMRVGAERINDIVKSMRNFSRVDVAELQSTNIHEGINSTLTILTHRLKATSTRPAIQISKQYCQESFLVECYPNQLSQVFMNILANAIDAIDAKVEIGEKFTPLIQIITEIEAATQQIMIRFVDNGIGINQDTQQRLFEPFYTTKPIGKGTGLGMTISHQIVVEKHKGELQYRSVYGEGTEFAIAIPLKQT